MSNKITVIVDEWGQPRSEIPEMVEGMSSPVLCNYCGDVYDLKQVHVIHRYTDCTTYNTPCCDKMVDDRMWISFPAFKKLK